MKDIIMNNLIHIYINLKIKMILKMNLIFLKVNYQKKDHLQQLNNVKVIYICLDQDARKQAIETAEYFMANGVDVYFVDIKEKDPSDIGFGKINNILAETEKLTSEWLIEQRILGV